MAKEEMNLREILVRKPIYRILPKKTDMKFETVLGNSISEPDDPLNVEIYTQSEMLREYQPSAHKINNNVIYPDVWKEMPVPGKPNQKRLFVQPITRVAVAMQRVLKVKRNTHVCGNDVQFELARKEKEEIKELENTRSLLDFKEGWLTMGMEERMYEAVDSIFTVSDAAIVFYFDSDNNPKAKTLSFINGDKLYPHYNSITGDLELFARKYYDYDEDGKATIEWVEVWDERYLYRFKRGLSKSDFVQKFKDTFKLAGFEMVGKPKEHGFYPHVPVAYHVNIEGPAWAFSQKTIEHYEEALSYFFENNKAYAFPIFYVKGKGVKLSGNMNGAVKAVSIPDTKGEAGFLKQEDVSPSYNTLLSTLYDLIYEQSFGVKPPELKSGDLPGVAVKLLFSPAIEQAISDAERLQPFLDRLVMLVKFAWGYKIDRQATLMKLEINSWIEPYIHQNDSELMQNLRIGVQDGFVSKQTASERASKYTKNDEMARYWSEYKRKQEIDLQMEVDEKKAEVDEEIRKMEEEAKINSVPKGNVRTGQGTKPRETDKWGNRPGENNWEEWNSTH